MGLAYSFKGLVHYCHGAKRGGMQAEMVLEEELRVLYLSPQAVGKRMPHWAWLELLRPQSGIPSDPLVTDHLQQGHRLVVPLPLVSIRTHESIGAIPIQTTTLHSLWLAAITMQKCI